MCVLITCRFYFRNQCANIPLSQFTLVKTRGEVAVGTTRTTKRNMNVEACGSHYLREIIACVCTISFPGVLFDNSFSLQHLAINSIYTVPLTGTHVDYFYVESLIIEHGRTDNMADDRMKDNQRNMGAGERDDQDFGQQSPGRG